MISIYPPFALSLSKGKIQVCATGSIVALLVGGLSGLFIKGFSWVNFGLAVSGIAALIGFLAASIRAYSRAEALLKKFEEEEKS